ncbi:molybdate ABC transporter substrate-binding protein [Sandaracinobacteroides hominis]|uniref:molybdate ABC transporter substrate-binding protein n=1 Tax=Sandaracinobacteroides hominis TaxID=2780086 RepID=UPI0018F7A0EB|nr:molybdate ABC transporter substrate-binding protein [Sandaracinobacteroides hominis]
MLRRIFLALLLLVAAPAIAQAPPAVAAAASLRYTLDEAAAAFARDTGKSVRITYAASGNLVQQIQNGAPYQLFLSADEAHVFKLAEQKLAVDRGTAYAVGRLALVAPPGSRLVVDPKLKGLTRALTDGSLKKLAIANPETAPYGTRTREVLQRLELWKLAQPRLVVGENIGQAFQFATTGGADGGFVSLSLVLSPGFKGRYAVVNDSWHQPLVQRMVLLKGAGADARAFHDWLLGPKGQAVLSRYGYSPPPR